MAKVFLSYARADRARVEGLASALEQAGHEVWWDRRIGGGAEFAREIEAALASASVVLVAWSENSVDSHWVRDEAAAGRDSGRLLPVTLDASPPPLGFRQFQTIDLSAWNGRPSAGEMRTVLAAVDASRPHEIPSPRLSGRKAPRRLVMPAAAAGIAAAVAGTMLYWPTPSEAVAAPELDIARVEASSTAVDPQLVAQLRDELRTTLSSDNAIAVSSGEASARPGARFALNASLGGSSDRLKLSVELADRESGITLWSRIIDLPEGRPDLAPRRAAYTVGTVVRCTLSNDSQRLSGTALGHWATLCEERWSNPNASIDRYLAVARKATEAAPDFSPAWSSRAMAAVPVPGSTADEDPDALRKEAEEAVERALRLDPQNSEAYAAKALLRPLDDYAGREALLKKALSVRPTDCVCEQVMYGQFLMSLGRIQEAYEHFQRAHEMRPVSPHGSVGQAHALFLLGREYDGRALLEEARQLWPDSDGLRMMALRSAIWTGRYDAAIAVLNEPGFKVPQPRREPWLAGLRALKSGSAAERREAVAKLVEASKRSNNMVIISILGALGAKAEALDAARRFIDQHGRGWAMVLFEPTLAESRETPQFAKLVNDLGMTRYWAQSDRPADFCSSAPAKACRPA